CECVARIRRLDRKKIAGVSLPRVHFATVRYGLEPQAPILERWVYTGKEAQKCFGSYRLFGEDSAHYSVLPATHTKWRNVKPMRQRLAEAIYSADGATPSKSWRLAPLAFASVLLAVGAMVLFQPSQPMTSPAAQAS